MSSPVLEAVRAFAQESWGQRVLVAVSGGADSMALLHAITLCGDDAGVKMHAAHLDHQLRADSGNDAARVERYCTETNIPFHSAAANVSALARSRSESIEAAGRHARYAFLERTADRARCDVIATAHTRDDQLETIYMRQLRGAGTRGLAGIPARRGRVVRPLLRVNRCDTRAYCVAHSIPFADDPSNADTRFFRNRVRHELLPALLRNVPTARQTLLAIGDASARELTRMRVSIATALEGAVTTEGNALVLDCLRLRALPEDTMAVAMLDLLYDALGAQREVSRVHVTELCALVPDAATGRCLSGPGFTARREHDGLVLRLNSDRDASLQTHSAPDTVTLTGPGRIGFGALEVSSTYMARNCVSQSDLRSAGKSGGVVRGSVAYFDADAVSFPLTVRAPAPGDTMRPFGCSGQRKLSDIFIDRKIPHRRRAQQIVIADRRRILWVADVTTSDETQVRTTSRSVLQLSITE